MRPRRNERGVALASVLWGMAALSLIAAAMLSSSMNATYIARNSWAQARAETAADSAIQRAVFSLFEPDASRRPPIDGSPQQITIDGQTVAVSVQDETGRIDINYATRNFLRDLLKASGATARDADTLADRIIDWRSPQGAHSLNGASADEYRRAGYNYVPRGGPFQSTSEVALVMGMTPELFARVQPALTVYSHSPDLDIRVAPTEALLAIPGMDEAKAEQIVAARAAAPPGAGLNFGTPAGHAFTITANATQSGTHVSRIAVVMVSADPAHPIWVLGWK